MPILAKGSVKEMQVPSQFELGREIEGGIASTWLRSCQARANKDILISLFFRGTKTKANHALAFRRTLSHPNVIFVADDENSTASEETTTQIMSLASALGNAANNQISNKQIGIVGPRFFLKQLYVDVLKNKPVLSVKGHFHDYHGAIQSYYQGIFFDGSPHDNSSCQIEEIVFEAPDEHSFSKYSLFFEQSLDSISWDDGSG